MDIVELKFKADFTDLDAAARKVKKAEMAMALLRGELIQSNGRVIDLGRGFTKAQANMLASLKAMGATNSELKRMAKSIHDVNAISKVNPFDGAADPLLKARKATDELAKGLQRAAQFGDLTKKQLEEVGRAAQFAQQRASAMYGTGRESFGRRQAEARKYVNEIVEQFRAQNELNRTVEEKNRIEKEAVAVAKQQEETMKRQRELTAMHERNLREQQERRVNQITKEVNAWQKAEQKKSDALQKRMSEERFAGDQMVRLYRKQEQDRIESIERVRKAEARAQADRANAIRTEFAKLNQQRAALSGGSRAATGNVVFRLTEAGATPEQIRQAQALRKEIERLSGTQNALRGLQGVLRGLFPAMGALAGSALFATGGRVFVETADAIQLLANRIQILSNNTVEFEPAFARLKEIADTSRAPIMELGTLYARLIPVFQSTGKTSEYAEDVTRAFALAMTISGTAAQEARSGLLQFSQAMSSATFNGDEFRAISEAVPEILRVLEKQLGVTRAELRKMSADGKLTSEIVGKALVDSIGELEERVKSAPLTLSQSTTLLNNEFKMLAKNINDTFQITQGLTEINKFFATMLGFVNDNKEALSTLRDVLNTLVQAALLAGLAKLVISFQAAYVAATTVTVATQAQMLAQTGLIARIAGTTAAMVSYATTLGVVGLAKAGLTAATGALIAALNILKAHPVITGLTLLATGFVVVKNLMSDNVQTAEQLADVNTDLGLSYDQVRKAQERAFGGTSQEVQKYNELMQAHNTVVEQGVKDYDALIRQKEQAVMRANSHANGLANEGQDASDARAEVSRLRIELEKLVEAREKLLNRRFDPATIARESRDAATAARVQALQGADAQTAALREEVALFMRFGNEASNYVKANKEIAELDAYVTKQRELGLPVDQKLIENKHRMILMNNGIIKSERDVSKARSDSVNNFDNITERVTELYARVTGATKDLTEAEKLRDSLLTDERFKKLTESQKQLVLGRLQEISAIEKVNEAERKAKEFNDKRIDALSEIYDSIRAVSEVTDMYGGFLQKINELEFQGIITTKEATEALNAYARARINAANTEAGRVVTERQEEFNTRTSDFNDSRVTFGMTDSDKNIYERQRDIVRELNKDIENLRKLENADPAFIQSQIEKLKALADQNSQLVIQEENLRRVQDEADKFAGILTDAFDSLIFQGESFSDVLKNMERGIMDVITQVLVLEPLKASLRGAFADGGGMSKMVSSAMSTASGAIGSFFSGLFFADGGRPPVGKASVVGERGPELFVPDSAGTIIPNHMLASPTNNQTQNVTVIQNFTIQGQAASRETQAQLAAMALQGANRAMARNT